MLEDTKSVSFTMNTFAILVILVLCSFATGSNIDHSSKVVGGHQAVEAQFPYIVSIRNKWGDHTCGGTIINKRTIVTAAHCKSSGNMTVYAGSINNLKNGILYTISDFIKHENFNLTISTEHDIGVIILNNELEFNDNIQPIPLVSSDVDNNASVTASGWGYTEYPGFVQTILRWIELQTISQETCKEMHTGKLFDSQICTYTKFGEGICSGDSGGPLVANGELVGVCSSAYLCARGKPDFFTRVYSYKSWVQEHSVN